MKSSQFIEKIAHKMRNNEPVSGMCSSVVAADGQLYSYGRHYPLLYPVKTRGGKTLLCLNASGYSMTTSKHIGWAARHADIVVHGNPTQDTEGTIAQLESELVQKNSEIARITRKNTIKERLLTQDVERITAYISALNS